MASRLGLGGQAEEEVPQVDMVRPVFASQEENFGPADLASEAWGARQPFVNGELRATNPYFFEQQLGALEKKQRKMGTFRRDHKKNNN